MILFWRDKNHTVPMISNGVQITVPGMEEAKEVRKEIKKRFGVTIYLGKADVSSSTGLTRRSRQTGTLVTLEEHSDPELPWLLICEEHHTTMQFETKSAAIKFMPVPNEWCEECR